MGKPGKRPAVSPGGSCSRFWSLSQASLGDQRQKSANSSFEAPEAPPPWVAKVWKAIRILSVCLTGSSRPLASSLPLSCIGSPHGSTCGPFNSQCRYKVPQKEATGLTWGRCPPQVSSAVGRTDCAKVWQVPGKHVAGAGSSGSQKERVGPHQTSGASRPLPWPELADTWP